MSVTSEPKQKYLINIQEGANHLERASISLILAVSASKEHEAAMFVTSRVLFGSPQWIQFGHPGSSSSYPRGRVGHSRIPF